MTAAPTDDEATGPAGTGLPGSPGRPTPTLAEAVGGPRGILDSSLPTVVFVSTKAAGSLAAAAVAAVACAVALALWRVRRGEPWQQAASGLFAVAVAVVLALRTHRAEAFFLPGIALQAVYLVAVLGSVFVGRPVVGYVAAALDPTMGDWRAVPRVRRAAAAASVLWAAVFGVRLAVQAPLYATHHTGLLALTKIVMGWPLWALAVAGSYLLLHRAGGVAARTWRGAPKTVDGEPSTAAGTVPARGSDTPPTTTPAPPGVAPVHPGAPSGSA